MSALTQNRYQMGKKIKRQTKKIEKDRKRSKKIEKDRKRSKKIEKDRKKIEKDQKRSKNIEKRFISNQHLILIRIYEMFIFISCFLSKQ